MDHLHSDRTHNTRRIPVSARESFSNVGRIRMYLISMSMEESRAATYESTKRARIDSQTTRCMPELSVTLRRAGLI